jgi:phospholipid/cholesterol/gamma-HCH transport system substrate-binding protein
MNRTARQSSLTASPVLVGAVTILVTVLAVFISYNANSGLPFVPSYELSVTVPDASGLVRGNEVRVGGKRVGTVAAIDAVPRAGGPPAATLELKLDQRLSPLRSDTRVTVRPLSPLGLKYLELVPGRSGRPLAAEARLPLRQATETVELDQVLNAFDDELRRSLQVAVDGLGIGVAGRGSDFNSLLADTPPLLGRLERVAANVGDPRTGLDGALRGADRVTGELAAAGPSLGGFVENADTTAGALADVRGPLGDSLEAAPPAAAAGTEALRAARPVLGDAEALVKDIAPGLRELRPAATRLHAALDTGVPVLRRATGLAGRLDETLAAVESLARDPATRPTLRMLRAALVSAAPTLEFLAPLQTRCNYLGLWTRNVVSTISEGDVSGTWFRTLVVLEPDEMLGRGNPAPGLHVNPYGHAGANGECEVGREPYLPGARIGNVPGHQGGSTEDTRP